MKSGDGEGGTDLPETSDVAFYPAGNPFVCEASGAVMARGVMEGTEVRGRLPNEAPAKRQTRVTAHIDRHDLGWLPDIPVSEEPELITMRCELIRDAHGDGEAGESVAS